jgi:hypothetical protein
MKKINEIINESKLPEEYKKLNNILRQTGWPQLEEDNGNYKSIDEDTVITFNIDDYDNKPYISKIECNFATSDPSHLRDLNGLVDLFEKILKLD